MHSLFCNLNYPSRSSSFTLYYLTDTHIGAKATAETLLRKHVALIAADPTARWIGGGDYIDGIGRKGDKRFLESTLAPWLHGEDDPIGRQRDYFLDMVKPIAHQCLGLVSGNHEAAVLKYADRDIYREIVKGVAQQTHVEPSSLALGVQGFVSLRFRRSSGTSVHDSWLMNIYCFHGAGGGRLPGGHALALGRILGDYDCDLALIGHRHVRQFVDKTVIGAGKRGHTRRYRAALFVASYLDAYVVPSGVDRPVDTYPEEHGLPPQSLGTTPILIDPDAREFHIVMSSSGLASVRQPMLAAGVESVAATA